ncbi:Uncharacterised protein [Lederbergia lenta]|uniref:Uncharacterized protein n=1 Tax=Lederbergia lenta TaxID=1467 RepID=A0A2X4YT17_LEDLE|nr:Uncharacterised protein [Lederbergia lenta]
MTLPIAIVVSTAIICVTAFLTAVTLKGMSMGE